MGLETLPYQPIRTSLYSSDELFRGFEPGDSQSFASTRDFAIYRDFVATGGAKPTDPLSSLLRGLHDTTISQALTQFIDGRRCVAIMGGHKMQRGTEPYRRVVELAGLLARDGVLVASGGGPGAMEAAHLGARLCRATDESREAAIQTLARVPLLPDLRNIVDDSGKPNFALVEQAHAWLAPAMTLATEDRPNVGESLSVPTWHYGHEPSTPLATSVAKYFQNSVREDGLLAIAVGGIVFTEGKAGTLQEVFQDAAQNYYHSFDDRFSPMVFLGVKYWQETLPVRPLLQALFGDDMHRPEYERLVKFTDSPQEAHQFIEAAAPKARKSGGYPALRGIRPR